MYTITNTHLCQHFNIFLDYKKNIISNDIDSIQDEVSDSSMNLSRTKLKRDMTDYNVSLMNYENSYSSVSSSIINLLELKRSMLNIDL